MQTISYTDARNQLAGLMESTIRNREPMTITKNGEGQVVMVVAPDHPGTPSRLSNRRKEIDHPPMPLSLRSLKIF